MRETCDQCRFDSDAYTDIDVGGALRAQETWWRLSMRGREPAAFARPAPGVWSAFEYADHTGDVLELLGLGAAIVAEQDGVVFPSVEIAPVTTAPAPADAAALDASLARIATLARALDGFVASGAMVSTNHADLGDGTSVSVGWLVRHALHDALHHLRDVNRNFAAMGHGTPPRQASVEHINVSDGGVPKRSIARTHIGYRGLAEDRQRERRHHGRVFQAVCLWSSEVIEALAADGHPIAAGAAGENLTIRGLDWSALRPGTRLRVGTATLELSVPAVPCAKNAQWFADRDFGRIHHDRAPDATRWYASVMADGDVGVGDPVMVEPSD
jgi:MOSC domain-containing protein YiiM